MIQQSNKTNVIQKFRITEKCPNNILDLKTFLALFQGGGGPTCFGRDPI